MSFEEVHEDESLDKAADLRFIFNVPTCALKTVKVTNICGQGAVNRKYF